MSKQNKTKPSFRLTPISVGFLCSTTVLLLVYPSSWIPIIFFSVIFFLVLLLLLALFSWSVTPELRALFDAYSKDQSHEDGKNMENIVQGKVFFGDQTSFFSVQIQPEGIFFSNLNFRKKVMWHRLWQIKETDKNSRFVEVTFVSDPKYNGIRKLVIPWKDDFWSFVPEAKKGR